MDNLRVSGVNFGAKVRVQPIKKKLTNQVGESLITTYSSGVLSSTSALGTASQSVASSSDVLATAFSAKASGINSSGIVPGFIESITPSATPATIATSQNQPISAGTLFSTISSWFKPKVKIDMKNPS